MKRRGFFTALAGLTGATVAAKGAEQWKMCDAAGTNCETIEFHPEKFVDDGEPIRPEPIQPLNANTFMAFASENPAIMAEAVLIGLRAGNYELHREVGNIARIEKIERRIETAAFPEDAASPEE